MSSASTVGTQVTVPGMLTHERELGATIHYIMNTTGVLATHSGAMMRVSAEGAIDDTSNSS